MPSYEEVRYHFNHHDPFARHMGIELLEVGPEHGVAIMPLDERHRNGMGHASTWATKVEAGGPGWTNEKAIRRFRRMTSRQRGLPRSHLPS